jgi:hypothetical protein
MKLRHSVLEAVQCFGEEAKQSMMVLITKSNPYTPAAAKKAVEKECRDQNLPFLYFDTSYSEHTVPADKNKAQIEHFLRTASSLKPLVLSELTLYEERVQRKAAELAAATPRKQYSTKRMVRKEGRSSNPFKGKKVWYDEVTDWHYIENDPKDFIS